MGFKVCARTDIGQRRTQNQDSYTVHPELGLFVVADGMGGHKGGEIASKIAVDTIAMHVKEAQEASPDWNPATVIRDAISRANQAIFDRSAKELALRGMGTTTTALLFKGDQMMIGHVGDSRCYFMDLGFRETPPSSALWQLTRDHSLVQEKLRAGIITREEVKTDQMKNVITRSVGFEEKVNVELYEKKAVPGDVFLLCSDGLSGLADDPTLLEITREFLRVENNIEKATEKLVERANANGGDDNITAILVQF